MDKYLSSKIKAVSFVCIIMVVFLHCYNFSDNFLLPMTTITEGLNYATFAEYFLCNGFTRVAVPLFFIISGYLFYRTYTLSVSSYFYKVKSRFISLVIPYLIWASIGILACILLRNLNIMPVNDMKTNQSLGGILNVFWYPPSFQFWFIKELFIFTLASPVLYLLVKFKLTRVLYFLALFAAWFFDMKSPSYIVWEALLFFSFGAYLGIKEKINLISAKISKNNILTTFIIWIILLSIKTILAGILTLDDNTMILLVLHKMCILLGIYTAWFGMDYILNNKQNKETLLKLSVHTFFIYCFHEPLLDIIIQSTLVYVNNSTLVNLITFLIYPITTILLAISVSIIFLRFVPTLRNILVGNRAIPK